MENDLSLVSLFITIAWDVWKFRNQRLFKTTNGSIEVRVDHCIEYVATFKFIKQAAVVVRKEKVLSWQPLRVDYIKMNFDRALFGEMGNTGVGIILKDEKGAVLFASNRKEVGDYSVDEIEALAALRGLQMILHMGFRKLQLEGESLTIVEAISSQSRNFTSHGPLTTEV